MSKFLFGYAERINIGKHHKISKQIPKAAETAAETIHAIREDDSTTEETLFITKINQKSSKYPSLAIITTSSSPISPAESESTHTLVAPPNAIIADTKVAAELNAHD